MSYNHDDPRLKTGENGLTVWKLQKMAQNKQFDELGKLQRKGLNMNSLPTGYAAGTGARVFDVNKKLIADALDCLIGENWRGKIFFTSDDKKASRGRNRIKKRFLLPRSKIVPMAKFDTQLLDSDPLLTKVKSNVVILAYADPETRPYWQEFTLTKIQVYDVMVAVKGKYGPVYIGNTWLGKYDKDGKFTAKTPDELLAWFFLDFNQGGLNEQREHHWDGSREEYLEPIPHIDN